MQFKTALLTVLTLAVSGLAVPASFDDVSLEARATIEQSMLSAHNSFRAKYNASALTWNAKLASSSESWAKACVYEHSSSDGKYGENLAAGAQAASFTAEFGFQQWIDEASLYNYSNPGFSLETGHFTQVVWKGTKEVGCGIANCASGTIISGWATSYLVCRYSPPGNVLTQFPANVGRPL